MALFSSAASLGSSATWSPRGERVEARRAGATLVLRQLAHLRVGGRVGDHGVKPGDLRHLRAVLADRRRHVLQPGEFARQRDKGGRVRVFGQPA